MSYWLDMIKNEAHSSESKFGNGVAGQPRRCYKLK